MAIWMVTIILLLTLYFLITEKIPIDLTAVGLIVVLMTSGLLKPSEAVSGLANPAVITVGSMFLMSEAMINTGVIGVLSQRIIYLSGGNARLALLIILVTVAVASAFMNNTPVVVLFIPVVMSMCCEFGLSPSKFLIPISYASILAGTCTLIGTSTNIIISDLSAAHGYGALRMFELSLAGLPMAVAGLVFLFFAAFRLLPELTSPVCEFDMDKKRYLAELHIPHGSPLIGREAFSALSPAPIGFEILELTRYSHVFYPGRDKERIAEDDILLVKGMANDIISILREGLAVLPPTEKDLAFGHSDAGPILVELVIPPYSNLVGAYWQDTELMRDPDLHIIAIRRSNLRYSEQKLQHILLKTGDILLIGCTIGKLNQLRSSGDVMVIEKSPALILNRRKAKLSVAIFAGFIIAATIGLTDTMVCAVTAVFLMAATGCIRLRDSYRSLQPKVLLLIAATIGLGAAMEKTGASRFYADFLLRLFSGLDPVFILGGILLMTSFTSHLLSNTATAVLILPLAISTALKLGLSPKPFIMAVCFGASACFATPVGYQTNLLVFGPGGYRFGDYLKLGLPLSFLVILLGMLLIPFFWPF